jgi:site-specific recombinase XerC
MQDLNYELKQLCARNRDGSFATQHDRERILTVIANQLREMGFVNMHVQSLKPKHVEKLVEHWKAEGLSTGTLKNRMTELRWWAEKNGKANVVAKSNDAYGIADRRYVTNVSKARELTSGDLAQVTDPYTRMSLQLQAAFGLRRKESIKIQPAWADRGDTLMIKASWGKGRRAREIPIRNAEQRRVLDEAKRFAGRPQLCGAAAPFRVPVRPRGHPPCAWPPPSVRARTIPRTHSVVGTGRRRTTIERTYARAEEDRSRSATDYQ